MDWIKCITCRLLCAGRRQAGITLIETVMAISIFGLVSTSLITVLTSATAADGLSRQRSIALELGQQQLEYVRQLGYTNVGTVSGNPPGVVLATQTKKVAGLWYTLTTRIRYVNDPIPSSYASLANYKQVRVTVARARDSKVLASVTTYLSSSTRDPLGGVDNAIVNIIAEDYKTHTRLENVSARLVKGAYDGSDLTDATGVATFAGLDPTESSEHYDAYATFSQYETFKDDLPSGCTNSPCENEFTLDPSSTVSKTVRLYKPSSIHVTIIDEATGSLYGGPATVTISSPRGSEAFSTITGEVFVGTSDTLAGEYIVPQDNAYSIKVDTPDYRHGELLNQTVPVDYANGQLYSNFEVTLGTAVIPQDATLIVNVRRVYGSGTCEDSTTYLSGYAVTIDDNPNHTPPYSRTLTTGSSGKVTFAAIPLGTYDVTARRYTRQAGISGVSVTGDLEICIPLRY